MLQINIDPESLKPKLPSRKDLKPYPSTCYLEYRGHEGAVLSISVEPSGQWIASSMNIYKLQFVVKVLNDSFHKYKISKQAFDNCFMFAKALRMELCEFGR